MKTFVCKKDEPVVKTKAGLLRGFCLDGVYHFRGIQYGVADRFRMPRDVEPWEGIRNALVWGYTAPVPADYMIFDDFTVPHRFWPQSEDCLYLNVWTTELNPDAKKPVLFWIHGGGFFNGSSMEMIAYDGENLSQFGDVVVVTINHRLNFLGYFDLSSFGKDFTNSGNCGMVDLVHGLRWVRDNIAAFGGDPENVTIFGQSGGGGKVTTLLQTPEADGLFHKAIIQSGVMGGMPGADTRDDAKLAARMIELLGGAPGEVSVLEKAPLDELQKAFVQAGEDCYGAGQMAFMKNGPVAGDWYVGEPMQVGFTEHAKTIPLMVGTVSAEMGYHAEDLPARDGIGEAETRRLLADEYGAEHVDEILAAFRSAYPGQPEVYALYLSNRLPALEYCKRKAEVSQVPVYNYNFAYIFPYDGGTPAWHCAEIPFVFRNADKLPICQAGEDTQKLQEVMSSAWVNFAKTGNPSGGAVGEWPALTPEAENTYVIDAVSGPRTGYDRNLMELVAKYQKSRSFF